MGGGMVLPGLKRRREEEVRLILDGVYDPSEALPPRRSGFAQVTLRLSAAELAAARDGFRKLGYDPGANARFVALDAVWRFQVDHDLTVDGILGRATLSTLQRRLDARRKSGQTIATGAGGAAVTQTPGIGETLSDTVILGGVAVVIALSLLWLAWRYRDVVAAKVQVRAPTIATWLRNR
jgi:lysozyme